ncbi:hypothetical protein NLI96_g3279 [Meripilus lineatus]|uniref:Major facilitator superfamily (MFS) profile domain-containing protein n=1 Tax=Meripilus lineatus TaxID=2056292 RepID=A0AAD5VBT5_9APHY|nr:hypothetical protein NLI96_g3279 [Physisporinus lineatus]
MADRTPTETINSQDGEEPSTLKESAQVHVDTDAPYLVELSPEDDPKNISAFRKWIIVSIVSSSALCVTCASSVAAFTEAGVARDFHVHKEVSILGISLFVQGLGIGPLLVGPLSELYGRSIIYRVSFVFFFPFTFPVSFSPNIAVFLVLRWLTGLSGSAFLSVAGGSVSDMFRNQHVPSPMAVYTISPFIGPVIGPFMSGFINQNLDWRWTYRVILIWIFVEMACLILFVPETYSPIILKQKAQRIRKSTGDSRYYAPLDKHETTLVHSVTNCSLSIEWPFFLTSGQPILLSKPSATEFPIRAALLLGILYLAFQAFPIIFEQEHNLSIQFTGLTFLGTGVGMIIGLISQPFWNRLHRKRSERFDGQAPPEEHLLMGQAGAILVPVSLFWLAFTTYKSVPWIVPIIASVPFGIGIHWCFTSTFTYLVVAYRPIAASAMAANTFVRTSFAAAFPLFAGQMYHRLGTVGATALLAGLTTLAAPLPIGGRLRAESRFTAT